jgi:hypothetical protein
MGPPMSDDDILRAHNKELFEHRVKELSELLDVPEHYIAGYILVDIVLKHRGIKLDSDE